MDIKTIEQAELYAAERGLVLTPNDRAKIAQIQAAEAERLRTLAPDGGARTWSDRFNAFYPRLLESLLRFGETVLTLAQTLIVSIGVPVVLVLLLVVEHHRVYEGILLFDANSTFASFAAWALVLLNLVLEFQVHYVEHRSGYQEPRARRWSLRLWLAGAAYRLGLGDGWQAQEQSPAMRYKQLLRLVTFTILALALVGSMKTVIQEQPGAWYDALVTILTDSSLLLLMTWLGGLLFAAAAVLSAQGLSRYVALRCVEIVAEMRERSLSFDDHQAAEVERAGALAALSMINQKEQQRTERAARQSQSNPFGSTPPDSAQDGPESGQMTASVSALGGTGTNGRG